MSTRRQANRRSSKTRRAERRVQALEAQLQERDQEIGELKAQLAEALKRIGSLEQQVKANSQNSDRPPSADPPEAPKRPRKPKSGRRRGAQPGHKGVHRKLRPIEDVDEVREHRAAECRGCGKPLRGTDPKPQRHQITEIPPITPHVVEHRLHALECRGCGCVTRGQLPVGVPSGAFGPRLQAIAAVLSGAYRLSKRNVEAIFSDVFDVRISLGSIKALEDITTDALAAPVEEARRYVKNQATAHLDETGWHHQNKKAWLWTAVAGPVAVFLIRASRGAKVAKELVGELFTGIVGSDRYSAYTWIDVLRRQVCWAHLKRDFQKISEMGGVAHAIGTLLGDRQKDLFRQWHRVRDGTLKRSSFRVYASRIRGQVQALLDWGAACDVPKAAGMCAEILKVEPALWTFARVPDVEPTNNDAERALRHAVIWRKTSFGTQSAAGRRFVEHMLTVVTSLRLQKRNVLEYVAAACDAALRGELAPSLRPLPLSATEESPQVDALAEAA